MHPIISHQRVSWYHWCHSNLGSESTGHQLIEKPKREGGLRWAARMKASDLYLAYRGFDEITSYVVATRTNLIPSCSLTHAEDGQATVSYFLTTNILFTGQEKEQLNNCPPVTQSLISYLRLNGSAREKKLWVSLQQDWQRQTLPIQVLCNYVFMRWRSYYYLYKWVGQQLQGDSIMCLPKAPWCKASVALLVLSNKMEEYTPRAGHRSPDICTSQAATKRPEQ